MSNGYYYSNQEINQLNTPFKLRNEAVDVQMDGSQIPSSPVRVTLDDSPMVMELSPIRTQIQYLNDVTPIRRAPRHHDATLTPIRHRDEHTSNVLDDLHSIQHDRSMRLYKYSSSSPRTGSSPLYGPINLRNKHNKLIQVRKQHRHDLLDLKREKVSNTQVGQDLTKMYEQQYLEEYDGVDLDKLIEEEEEREDYEEHLNDYEKDLLAQAELDDLEMAEMVAQLDLSR